MDINMSRDEVISFLKSLNKAILLKFIELRNEYEASPPVNSDIIRTFKTWKSQLEDTIEVELKKTTAYKDGLSSQTVFLSSLLQKHKEDVFLGDLFRKINSSTDMIKQFIRLKSDKDPQSKTELP